MNLTLWQRIRLFFTPHVGSDAWCRGCFDDREGCHPRCRHDRYMRKIALAEMRVLKFSDPKHVRYERDGYVRDGAHVMVGTGSPLSPDWKPPGAADLIEKEKK